jgi:hypothetical protein
MFVHNILFYKSISKIKIQTKNCLFLKKYVDI